ncbi:pyridoxal phosphate-dependent transferase [Gaertneriomyces semiglobifer]|nr:pyridoxal phosphate-dependent transferase [Gaertneriomyces semiglobifer]
MGSPPNAVGPVSDGIMDPLSTLAHDATQNPSALLEGLKKALANPYDKKTCPNGVINLGTAESHLMADVLLEKLNSPDIRQVTPAMLRYGTMYGSHQLRQAVANLINKHFRPVKAITPENITAHAGCGAAINNIAQALTNPGEGVLVPTPYYGGFDFDLRMYAQAKIVPVNTFSASHFMVTVPELEEAYQAAVSEGITVRVLLLTNPSNPSGRTQPADDVRAALEWAKSKKLQAVVDEIYALSTFSDDPVPFTSAYALANLPDPQNTHLLYGMSKDFCINGVRMGFVISYNKELLESLHMFAIFTCIHLWRRIVESSRNSTRRLRPS